MADFTALELALRQKIGGERLAHVYRVLATARDLARRFGAPLEATETAALMHDFAKAETDEVLLAEGRRCHLITDPAEESHPFLLHGPVAACWLQTQGLVTEPAALAAIRWHTTGRAGMSLVEKVIWLADYIEPGRNFPGVERVRTLAQADLDEALLVGLDLTIGYVIKQGWLLHHGTVQARNWLLPQLQRG